MPTIQLINPSLGYSLFAHDQFEMVNKWSIDNGGHFWAPTFESFSNSYYNFNLRPFRIELPIASTDTYSNALGRLKALELIHPEFWIYLLNREYDSSTISVLAQVAMNSVSCVNSHFGSPACWPISFICPVRDNFKFVNYSTVRFNNRCMFSISNADLFVLRTFILNNSMLDFWERVISLYNSQKTREEFIKGPILSQENNQIVLSPRTIELSITRHQASITNDLFQIFENENKRFQNVEKCDIPSSFLSQEYHKRTRSRAVITTAKLAEMLSNSFLTDQTIEEIHAILFASKAN